MARRRQRQPRSEMRGMMGDVMTGAVAIAGISMLGNMVKK